MSPQLREEWRPTRPLDGLAVGPDKLYLVSDDQLTAMDRGSKRVQWEFTTPSGASLMHAPVFGSQALYVGTGAGALFRLESTTGRIDWRGTADHSFYAPPRVTDSRVYAGSHDGRIYAFAAADGTEKWRFDTGGGVSTTPAVTADTLYVGTDAEVVYGLDRVTGRREWRYGTRGAAHVDPVERNETLYAGDGSGRIYALDSATGGERATEQLANATCRGLTVSEDTVVVSAQNGLFGFDIGGNGSGLSSSGRWTSGFRQAWNRQFRHKTAPPVVADGTVYCATYDGSVVGIDLGSGETTWTFEAAGPVYMAPAIAGDDLYIGCDSGHLYQFSATDPGSDTVVYTPESESAPAGTETSDTGVYMGADADGTDRSTPINFCPACGADLQPFSDPAYCPTCGEALARE